MLFRARSILQLTAIGFLIVVTLLVTALFVTARQLDLLTDASQMTAYQSAVAMRASRELVEHTGAMERNARQYAVLQDPALLEIYAARRDDYLNAIALLQALDLNQQLRGQTQQLILTEESAHQLVVANSENPAPQFEYPALLEAAHEVSRSTSLWVDQQVVQLRLQTTEAQRSLTLQTLLLVCTALIVAGLFIRLITQPLQQIDKAIYGIGAGAYQNQITVHGPKDLQLLGERLDWLRSRLGQLEEQRSSFLRHVSHELKTPLAAMQESAALLNDGIVGPLSSEQKHIISILSSNCQRLLDLIENLLRYNAGSFSVLEAMPQPVNLEKLINEVVATFELALHSNDIRIILDTSPLSVLGDEERLRVVLDNLLSNAVKYSPSGGIITVSLVLEESCAVITVQDQGPGITGTDVKNIFTAFYQGKAPLSGYYKGSGLGLAIAREYAESNGGTLNLVASDSGACFRAQFPLPQKD